MRAFFRLASADIVEVAKEFTLADGRLLRNGRRTGHVRGNQYYIVHRGRPIQAADIAWTLHFGHAPLYPLWQFDPEPFNISIGNLYPMRLKKPLRCRITFKTREQTGRFPAYFHSLSHQPWVTEDDARFNWRETVRDMLAADRENCIAEGARQQSQLATHNGIAPIEAFEDFAPYLAGNDYKKRPKGVPKAGKAHFYKGQWVIVNRAKCIADDYMLRCEAALAYIRGDAPHWDSAPILRHKIVTKDLFPVF